MKKIKLLFWLNLLAFQLLAQAPYTLKQYGWRVEKDLEYGVAVNYLGKPISLTLDLYKPVGDNNRARPLIVMVHGGAWLTGCKENEAYYGQEFAQLGYVVASVNYRKGWHKDDYVPNAINPGVFPGGNCLYAADSMEIIRAIYRGQQDVKGAIRWLKARSAQDSTCQYRVLVGGESAGAFVALAADLLDRAEEKPLSCYQLPDAPVPSANVSNCYEENCVMQTFVPDADGLKRPDLGPVEGTLNLNGYSANVIGVISFYGGVPYEAGANSWLQGPDTSAFYLFHQTCDGIVPFGYNQPMITISANCNLGFTPWHYNYPHTYGSGAIAAALQTIPRPPVLKTDFVNCDAFNPAIALFDCIRYNDNGSYHWVSDPVQRVKNIAEFFSPVVTAAPNCSTSAVGEASVLPEIKIQPNPFQDQLSLELPEALNAPALLTLSDLSGKPLWTDTRRLQGGNNTLFEENDLPPGFYFLEIRVGNLRNTWKVIKA